MKAFQQIQFEFIDHIKNPAAHPFERGIEDRRLEIYRELFFNNLLGFLSSGFPVLESLYSEQDWRALARHFFAEHQCRSPYFIDISKEFVEYLSNQYELGEQDPPFLRELAHYEWIELAVSVRKAENKIVCWDGAQVPDRLAMSELAVLVSYPYPVHQISPDFQPQEPGDPVYLVVYRNQEDEVNFTLLSPVSAHLLDLIQQSGEARLEWLVEALQTAMPGLVAEQVEKGAKETVQQMLKQQILVSVPD